MGAGGSGRFGGGPRGGCPTRLLELLLFPPATLIVEVLLPAVMVDAPVPEDKVEGEAIILKSDCVSERNWAHVWSSCGTRLRAEEEEETSGQPRAAVISSERDLPNGTPAGTC